MIRDDEMDLDVPVDALYYLQKKDGSGKFLLLIRLQDWCEVVLALYFPFFGSVGAAELSCDDADEHINDGVRF